LKSGLTEIDKVLRYSLDCRESTSAGSQACPAAVTMSDQLISSENALTHGLAASALAT